MQTGITINIFSADLYKFVSVGNLISLSTKDNAHHHFAYSETCIVLPLLNLHDFAQPVTFIQSKAILLLPSQKCLYLSMHEILLIYHAKYLHYLSCHDKGSQEPALFVLRAKSSQETSLFVLPRRGQSKTEIVYTQLIFPAFRSPEKDPRRPILVCQRRGRSQQASSFI